MGIYALSGGIDELMSSIQNIDLVFDATSASDHIKHADQIISAGKHLINLTPAKLGNYYVPGVTSLLEKQAAPMHLNMVTCGGQTAIPIIDSLQRNFPQLSDIEIVSTISSKSAGPATRRNLDEYIDNTEQAISKLTGVSKAKAMILLNPANPEILMHTSLYFTIPDSSKEVIRNALVDTILFVKERCPGYEISSETVSIGADTYHLAISVRGSGDYLPVYAGNLDIINVAAIFGAEEIVRITHD
ncbi:MhpF Acetaldehyde dehydrogenase (acetylating) [Candidatus Nanopelagicaceae bacterium]